jgi:hypothetical protein
MDINQAFPSKYVKAADLQGQDVPVTITHVQMEDVGGRGNEADNLPVAYFQGMTKGLVLNKTNANTIAQMYGFETNGWVGRPITLWPTECEFGGNMTQCVRVRSTAPTPAIQVQQPPAQQLSLQQPPQPTTVQPMSGDRQQGTVAADERPYPVAF